MTLMISLWGKVLLYSASLRLGSEPREAKPLAQGHTESGQWLRLTLNHHSGSPRKHLGAQLEISSSPGKLQRGPLHYHHPNNCAWD